MAMILTIDEVRAVLARKGDLHLATAAKAFNTTEAQVTKEQRAWAKQSNFRHLYTNDFWEQVYGPLPAQVDLELEIQITLQLMQLWLRDFDEGPEWPMPRLR